MLPNVNFFVLSFGKNLNGLLFYNNIEDSINLRVLNSKPLVSENIGFRTTSAIDEISYYISISIEK